MEACTIFSSQPRFQEVLRALEQASGSAKPQVDGEPDAWKQIVVERRRLLSKSVITFSSMVESDALANLRKGMGFAFSAVPTDHLAVKGALLARLQEIRFGVEISAKRLVGNEDLVFAVAKAIDGVIFWGGSEFLDTRGRIILDLKGNCRIPEFDGAKAGKIPLPELPAADQERKKRTETALKEKDIPVNAFLPMAVPSETAVLRSPEEIADRALALTVLAIYAESRDKQLLAHLVEQYDLKGRFSPMEQAFLDSDGAEEQAKTNALWRYESAAVMFWALGLTGRLEFPDKICDVDRLVGVMRDAASRSGMLAQVQMRAREEILDAADMALRIHWAVVAARLKGQEPEARIVPGVAFERHYAFNWIVGCGGPGWDDIETNT